jgi:uncharacterized cupredoxin-like copper-binding protein
VYAWEGGRQKGDTMSRNLMGTALALGAAATVLTACSSGGSSGGSAGTAAAGTSSDDRSSDAEGTSSDTGGESSGAAGSATRTVQVSATEFALKLSTTTFAPGAYTFVMSDDGHATHAIELQGPGVDGVKSGTVGPGGSSSLTATLQKGTYTLWCPVANHRAEGMQTTLTVR